MPEPRNARAEANALLGEGRVATVLEPTPPAVNEGPWFADHPPTRVDGESGDVVSCLSSGALTWADAVAADPGLADFARAHWLANHKPLSEPPASLTVTRTSLTALAFYVLAPARHAANGKIGLRWTKGGFGTPFFGDDRQVRVEGATLVIQSGGAVVAQPISTLAAAGVFVGVQPGAPSGIDFHDMPDMPEPDAVLEVDAAAVDFLDDWFGFATFALERLREDAGSPEDTRVQLWPEHFDPAIELGAADAGARASFGASPGDAGIDQPYLYVAPWSAKEGVFWSAPFGGAALTLADLRTAEDQVGRALSFFDAARQELGQI